MKIYTDYLPKSKDMEFLEKSNKSFNKNLYYYYAISVFFLTISGNKVISS
jgi:hypothetical protein